MPPIHSSKLPKIFKEVEKTTAVHASKFLVQKPPTYFRKCSSKVSLDVDDDFRDALIKNVAKLWEIMAGDVARSEKKDFSNSVSFSFLTVRKAV